jgi:hypothetical protein
MKRLLLLVIIGALLFSTCKKDEKCTCTEQEQEQPGDNKLGCIEGKITFFNTGSVTDAYVMLSSIQEEGPFYRELIKSNGDYTIDNVEEGTYFFKVEKAGAEDNIFPETIKIEPKALNEGGCRKMDWAISKLPPHLYLVEVNTENVLDTIDFGSYGDRYYFQIYNNSANTYTWSTDFEEVKSSKKWLGTITPNAGTLKSNDNPVTVIITIDRTKLETGQNSAKFLINSDNGGAKVLTIIATTP